MRQRNSVQARRAVRFGAWMCLCGLLLGCSPPPANEASLRETLDAMQEAGEAGSVDTLMTYVAEDFAGPEQAADRRELRRLLTVIAMRVSNISVSRTSTEIQMFDQRATAKLGMWVTASSNGILPDEGRSLNAETGWRIDDGEWRLIRAKWD